MSTRRWPRTFAHRLTSRTPRPLDVLRLMARGGFRPSSVERDRIPVRHDGLREVQAGAVAVTWVGHASVVLRFGDTCVLVDPVWSKRIPGVPPRLTRPGVALRELPAVDAVLISHNHYDHLDAPTIHRLPRSTPVLVPAGLGGWFRRRGFRRVTELDWWESSAVAGLHVEFVPAHHWSRRTPFDTCRSLWGGWVVTDGAGHRVYHAGDSGYGPFFGEIGRRHPAIDLAMLPIGAYQPRWFMSPVHVDPDEAVRAFGDLGALRMATMHWGTFPLSQEPVGEPIERARAAWARAGWHPDRLWDLAIGETRELPLR